MKKIKFLLKFALYSILLLIGIGIIAAVLSDKDDNSKTQISKEKPVVKETGDILTAYTVARSEVKKRLKAPSTAKFPFESYKNVTKRYENQIYVVESYVDAQNAFGAMIRSNYKVKLERTGQDTWKLLEIDIQ